MENKDLCTASPCQGCPAPGRSLSQQCRIRFDGGVLFSGYLLALLRPPASWSPSKLTAGRSKGSVWPQCRVCWAGQGGAGGTSPAPWSCPKCPGRGLGTPVLVAATESLGSGTRSGSPVQGMGMGILVWIRPSLIAVLRSRSLVSWSGGTYSAPCISPAFEGCEPCQVRQWVPTSSLGTHPASNSASQGPSLGACHPQHMCCPFPVLEGTRAGCRLPLFGAG